MHELKVFSDPEVQQAIEEVLTCVHCQKSDHPEEIARVGDHFAHIDCAYEHYVEQLAERLVDPKEVKPCCSD